MKSGKRLTIKHVYLSLIAVHLLLFSLLVTVIPFIKLDSYLITDPAKITILQLLSGGVLYWEATGLAFSYFTDQAIVSLFIVLALFAPLMLLIKKRDFTYLSVTVFLFASVFLWLLSFNVNPYQTRFIMFVDNGSIITPAISFQITWLFFLIYFVYLFSYVCIIAFKRKSKSL